MGTDNRAELQVDGGSVVVVAIVTYDSEEEAEEGAALWESLSLAELGNATDVTYVIVMGEPEIVAPSTIQLRCCEGLPLELEV